MRLLISEPVGPSVAHGVAQGRELLPSVLSSREQREAYSAALRSKSVFSARVVNVRFLEAIRGVVDGLTAGEVDYATARWRLKASLEELGYTPEGGFPDDMVTPPAKVGGMGDLSSDRRLGTILRTQVGLMAGRAQQLRGRENGRLYPAWELVRLEGRAVPRNWEERWVLSGGTLMGGRMVARKDDEIWAELGDAASWDDALDVDYPPFAWGSGMGWRAVSLTEWRRLGGGESQKAEGRMQKGDGEAEGVEPVLPGNVVSVRKGEAADSLEAVLRDFDGVRRSGRRVSAGELREMEREENRRAYAERYGLGSDGESE